MADKGCCLIHEVMAGVRGGHKIFICYSFRVLEGDGKEDTLPSAEEAVQRMITDIWISGFSPAPRDTSRGSPGSPSSAERRANTDFLICLL